MEKERRELIDDISKNTLKFREQEWRDNFHKNLDSVKGSYGVASLLDTLKDVPCILVGSGPTLNYNIDQLKGLQDRACIIAVASNLCGLLAAGVKPHLVMMTDSKATCLRFLEGLDLSEISFIVETFAHPTVVERLQSAKRMYWYNTIEIEMFPFSGTLDQHTGFIGQISTGGCAVTTGWCMARNNLGCDPDILVGVPEAFYDPGSPYSAASAGQYSSLLTKHHTVENYESPNIDVIDAWGRPCYTKAGFLSFAYWFAKAFVDVPGLHINCSEGGIVREHNLIMALSVCAERYLTAKYDIESMLFAHEIIADEIINRFSLDAVDRPFLTWLVGGPSCPTLALRMGWTEAEVAQKVLSLRSAGVNITETPYTINLEDGGKKQTLIFQLGKQGENSGSNMREEREQSVSREEPRGD